MPHVVKVELKGKNITVFVDDVAKADGSEYMIGPVTNQAVNMPEKVKQFFDKLDKQKEKSKE